MCKRNCAYQGGTVKKWNGGESSCNYSTAMARTNQKYKTRTKLLQVKVEKKHPNWTPQKKRKWVMKYLQGENCPFCEPIDAKPAPVTEPPAEKKPAEEKKRRTTPRKINEEQAMLLYRQGLNDPAMAEKLNVTANAVWYWRQRKELPANGKRGGDSKAKQKYDRGQIRRVLEEGQSVKQITSTLGCGKDTIYRIARREGLDIHAGKEKA